MSNYKDKYKRKNFIMLCFDDNEIEVINQMIGTEAKAKNLREILLANNKQFKAIINNKNNKNVNKDVVYELNKIGINLNQITKKINTNTDKFLSDSGRFFIDELNKINTSLNEIKRGLL